MSGPTPSQRLGALLISVLTRLLGATWRVSRSMPPEVSAALERGPVVFCFWHGEQLPLAWLHRDQGVVGLASLSRDGELLAQVIERLGYGTLRGSTSRGGSAALKAGVRLVRQEGKSLALAVDGPRGPRHEPHPGAAAIASLGRVPMVLVASRSSPALELKSWDRFVVPWPFARLDVAYGLQEPPQGRARPQVEAATRALRDGLETLGRGPEAGVRETSSP